MFLTLKDQIASLIASSGSVRRRSQMHFLSCRISVQLQGYKYKSTQGGKAIIKSSEPCSEERDESRNDLDMTG